jgi:hypothetical protein
MNRRWVCFALSAFLGAVVLPSQATDVPQNSISIKVGQELFISFTASGNSLVSPRTLPDGKGTDPMVTVQLTQSGPTRTLMVTNGYDRGLNYRAVARIRGRRKEFELPVNAVRSGMQSVLTLGEPFDELVLFEFHLQS